MNDMDAGSMSSIDCRFVCFVGIDGSGKSTLAHSVVNALSEQAMNFQYVHGLVEGRLSKPFMTIGRFLFARGESRDSDYAGFVASKRRGLSKWPAFFFAYRTIVIADYLPQIFWKIVLPLRHGRRILSDRYVYDTAINLELNLGCGVDGIVRSSEALFRLVPRPDLTFLVDVPEELAFSRKHDVPHIEYLQERRALYREVAKAFDMIVLDGSQPTETLTDAVVERIRKMGGLDYEHCF